MTADFQRILPANAFLIFVVAFATRGAGQTALQVQLQPEQTNAVLGAPVEFKLSIKNISKKPVRMVRPYLDPETGDVGLLVSSDGVDFHPYFGPQWQTAEMGPTEFTLQPGESIAGKSFPVLVNQSSPDTPTEPTKDFAFPAPGIYFVKATVDTSLGLLSSNMVRVLIGQPAGDDAAVWEQLQHDKELARFIQKPFWDNPSFESQEVAKLKQLLERYPRSSQAASMKKALDRHAATKAAIEKLRKPNSNPNP